jgi:hypothetical protein
MRRAGVLAVAIAIMSTALLYQNNVRARRPPEFARGGPFAGGEPVLSNPSVLASPTPVPGIGKLHSSATLTAPRGSNASRPVAPGAFTFPQLGRYTFKVDGWEEATAFGRRDYAPEMQMTVHRPDEQASPAPKLKPDELDFDLEFSPDNNDHEEREIVAYRAKGLVFTFESGSITFGPGFTRTSSATYDPPMTQIPVPLREGVKVTGTSDARDPSNGTLVRTEDWTVQVKGREQIPVLGRQTVTWVVQIDRQSRPGTPEQDTRSRTYWFDPGRRIWVKWTENLKGSQGFGPGDFSYQTQYTATLAKIEPLAQ